MKRSIPTLLCGACALFAVALCTQPTRAQSGDMRARAEAVHVLNRLTFGPRPGDVERVLALGVRAWIDRQLAPVVHTPDIDGSELDAAAHNALQGCPAWRLPLKDALATLIEQRSVRVTGRRGDGTEMQMNISLRAAGFQLGPPAAADPDTAYRLENNQLVACRLRRAQYSEYQLLEVMTDFWENHFSTYSLKLPARRLFVQWDREVIRPHALGRFRDLLGGVARSPIMLTFLDNVSSSAPADQVTLREFVAAARGEQAPSAPRTGLNENFARELLELHTMGADAGYTQADVIDVARAFTGWTHSGRTCTAGCVTATGEPITASGSRAPVVFAFDSVRHDAGVKTVLGRQLAHGRGMQDGEEVLDILARHPSTARFIAHKLAVRFVSDAPPPALVARAAATFERTDGDIREVVRTIVTSEEFLSPTLHGVKVRSPLELVLGMRRALAAPVDLDAEIIDVMIALKQPPFGRDTPDGWPETGEGWMNHAAIMARLELAHRVAEGELASMPLQAWPHWSELVAAPFTAQVDGVIRTLLHGNASPALRAALLASAPDSPPTAPAARERALRRLIALALGSPQFQRR